MSENYRVRVTKDYLVFSAAHFITFAGDNCERLHGHNYRVEVEADGPLDENDYVIDFIALRDYARSITDRLDHRVLLPTQSKRIAVSCEEGQVMAQYKETVWSFPEGDCILLPVSNTTAELLARWIGYELLALFAANGISQPERLCVHVEENFGQWGTCEIRAPEVQ